MVIPEGLRRVAPAVLVPFLVMAAVEHFTGSKGAAFVVFALLVCAFYLGTGAVVAIQSHRNTHRRPSDHAT
jgi:hypothetical protein